MPAIAAAASPRTSRLMRLMPAISTTELSIRMSLSPTYGRTCPEASVLTISLGTPSGSARMAAVPMVVPAEPPMREHAVHFAGREGLARRSCAASAAAAFTACPRSPAPAAAARIDDFDLDAQLDQPARGRSSASGPLVSSVARR